MHVWLYASDYFFTLQNCFSFIIMSVCVAFIFHLIITKFTLYPLLDYTLYRIVPVYLLILTVYKHTSVDAHCVTRPIELVLYTHSLRENYSLVKLVQETSIRESDCPGNVCKASFLHRMLVSVWDVQNIKQQMTAVELRCLHVRMVIIQWTRNSRLINSWKIRPIYSTLVS